MKRWNFERLLQEDGTFAAKYVETNDDGQITLIDNSNGQTSDESITQATIPGFPNAHSHAFQFSMAGTTEYIPEQANSDDFWSWRNSMYQQALRLNPEDVYKITARVYGEMLRHGLTKVVEFHYLHHDLDGTPYTAEDELCRQIMQAACDTGMALTLVPVYYKNGDFDKPANASQRRFVFQNVDHYLRFLEKVKQTAASFSRVQVGAGVHSLRAASQDDVKHIFREHEKTSLPIHVHIAEQTKEIETCKETWGARPVEWLLNNVRIGSQHNLVHATHLNSDEKTKIAEAGAQVVVCPSTEGNLGDGFFDIADHILGGGNFSIGTDSHVGLNPWEELRWLDYGQRMRLHKRNPLSTADEAHSGNVLFKKAWFGGQQSAGTKTLSYFQVGHSLDAVVIDDQYPALREIPEAMWLSGLVYAGDATAHLRVLTAGKDRATGHSHLDRNRWK